MYKHYYYIINNKNFNGWVVAYRPNHRKVVDSNPIVRMYLFCNRRLVCVSYHDKLHAHENEIEHNIQWCSGLKAILQVLIYKALYDKSYLGSKTTMTSGEWTCLISFATAPLTCSEQGGCEKFKMKTYVSSGIRTHTPPVHDRKVSSAP